MLDEPRPGIAPEDVSKPAGGRKPDANPTVQQDSGKGVASYTDETSADVFNPAKIVERWKGELKGVPEPEGFDPAKFNPAKIVERWKSGPAKAEPVSIPTAVTPAKK